jgi:hypothetical protein
MNDNLKNLVTALDYYKDKDVMKDSEYMKVYELLSEAHGMSAEGLDSDRRRHESEVRADEAFARELTGNIDGYVSGPILIENVYFYCPVDYNGPYMPEYIYHRCRSDGRDTIRNPRTGIFVLLNGELGSKILDTHHYSVDYIMTLKNSVY